MNRLLRRVGGIKRLFFGILAFLAIFYIGQTLMFNGNTSKGTDSTKSGAQTVVANNSVVRVVASGEINVGTGNPAENKAGLCDVDAVCPQSTLVFTVRALRNNEGSDQERPQFCVNGQIVSSAPTAPKTVSVAVVTESKQTMEELKHFDVSVDDKELRDYLLQLQHRSVVFLSSAGDVKNRVKEETKSVLRTQFGAKNDTPGISSSSFVFIGQKGLKPGIALDKYDDAKTQNGADMELRGCLQVPMGELQAAPAAAPVSPVPAMKLGQVVRRDSISFGPAVRNCGSEKPCPRQEFSVSVYSGKNKDDEPKICVDGRLIMSRSLNKGGRGLNAVILNATTKRILRVGHFDTYAEDSSSLEVFLEEMVDGEMVIVVSFDEASTHFSAMLKQMFYELGSALVQNLKFRASWFLAGQKGISGFSPFEELNFATGNDWAKPVDKKFCVPPFLDGIRVRADPIIQPRNEAKRHFCEKHDGYEEFCEDSNVDDPIMPAPLVNRSMNGNPIFKVPILIVSGLAHNSLRLCLETLIHQSGIDPKYVLVTYDENYAESGELAKLFQFKSKAVTSSGSYTTQLAKSFDSVWELYPDADVSIVIEEELMVTADFMYFMAQMLPILRSDQTLTAISAWNINGFTDTSTLPELVYRVEDFPGLACMIRKETYVKYMQGKMDECCSAKAWEGWNINPNGRPLRMIVPDVSRVIRRHIDGLGMSDPNVEEMFHRDRAYSKSPDVWITNSKSVSSDEIYDAHLGLLINSSTPLNANMVLKECLQARTPRTQSQTVPSSTPPLFFWKLIRGADSETTTSRSYVLYYEESNDRTPQQLRFVRRLRRCFGLYFSNDRDVVANAKADDDRAKNASTSKKDFRSWTRRGLYKGVLRFSYRGHSIFLIGSRSPFYRKKQSKLARRRDQQRR